MSLMCRSKCDVGVSEWGGGGGGGGGGGRGGRGGGGMLGGGGGGGFELQYFIAEQMLQKSRH